MRRALSGINPFSHQQIPTSERIGLNIKYGRKYYREEVSILILSLIPIQLILTVNIHLIMTLSMTKDSQLNPMFNMFKVNSLLELNLQSLVSVKEKLESIRHVLLPTTTIKMFAKKSKAILLPFALNGL